MKAKSVQPMLPVILASVCSSPQSVHAQNASEVAPEDVVQEVVTVTGSRLDTRSGFEAPTPLAIVGAEELQAVAPGNISSALNSLPQFQGSRTSTNAGQGFSSPNGASLLNLRNLGPHRNLVLLDGRRMMPSTDAGAVDINLFPRDLVKRVEVVTGGASAAYGSDAVSGVVNFVLDKEFEGVRGEVLGGISDVADGASAGASISAGTSFAGGRGHLLGSAEIYRMEDIAFHDPSVRRRDWVTRSWGRIPNPAGSPRFLITDDVRHADGNYSGLITSGPLRGTTFGPGGVPQPFNYGSLVSSSYMRGGDGVFPFHQAFTSGVDRWNVFVHAEYDLTDKLTVFTELQSAQTKNDTDWFYDFATGQFAMTIFRDNAFLPAELGARMDELGITSFPMGRYNTELLCKNSQDTRMRRAVIGFEGRFGPSWSYDAYYSKGWTDWYTRLDGNKDLRKFYAAVDAVLDPDTGQIVCRSTLAGMDPGCVPFNPFGPGAPSRESIDYFSGVTFRDAELEQDFVAFTVRGDVALPFGADPLAVAAGVEYRKESAEETSDAVSQSRIDLTGLRGAPPQLQDRPGGWLISNPQPQGGSYDVKEAFVEFGLPLLRDALLARQLNINASVRSADYAGTGSVTAWKIGATYAPIDDARLRLTRSRDIRAANILERFAARQTFGLNFVTDPATGAQIPFIGVRQGNPKLGPELADTWTAGLVIQPEAVPGLSLSVDMYNIEIEDAIASLSPQLTVDQCAEGLQLACDNIVESAGTYTIFQPFLNLASQTLRGVDFELGYATRVGPGDLSLRLFASDRLKATQTTPGARPTETTDAAGKWQGKLTVGYSTENFSLFLQERYIGGGLYNTQFVEGVDIDDNSLPAVWYTDLTTILRRGGFELFLTVNNLLDKDPPPSPSVSTFQDGADRVLYDFIGRYYTAGVRMRL